MRLGTLTKAATVCTAGVLVLAGCGGTSDGGSERLTVVTGVYPLEWLAGEVGGDRVEVVQLTDPGTEPHQLELGPQQVGQISEADVVLYIEGLQPAVDDAVEQEAGDNTLNVANLVELRSAAENDGRDQGHEDADHQQGEGHDHGEKDPHMWLDPKRMAKATEGLGDRLAEIDPAHKSDYGSAAKRTTTKLNKIDTKYSDGLDNCQSRIMVTNHTAFGYLAARYDLEQVGISGLGPESEPSPARLAEISDLVEKKDVATVFTEALASDKVANTIAEETGARTEMLDPIAGITKESPGDDYPSVMRANLATLRDALRCE